MENLCRTRFQILLLGVCLLGLVSVGSATKVLSKDAKDVAKWVENVRFAKQEVSHLHFYVHDIVSRGTPTSQLIAESALSENSTTGFGILLMTDYPLTVGPSTNSTLIGYARGLDGAASQTEFAHLIVLNLVFTGGKFNGSTLAVVGDYAAVESRKELSIVGGTGVFRLARGVATTKNYVIDETSPDSIVECNVAVLHY